MRNHGFDNPTEGYFQQQLSNLSHKYGVSLQISGLEALTTFHLVLRNLIYKHTLPKKC